MSIENSDGNLRSTSPYFRLQAAQRVSMRSFQILEQRIESLEDQHQGLVGDFNRLIGIFEDHLERNDFGFTEAQAAGIDRCLNALIKGRVAPSRRWPCSKGHDNPKDKKGAPPPPWSALPQEDELELF